MGDHIAFAIANDIFKTIYRTVLQYTKLWDILQEFFGLDPAREYVWASLLDRYGDASVRFGEIYHETHQILEDMEKLLRKNMMRLKTFEAELPLEPLEPEVLTPYRSEGDLYALKFDQLLRRLAEIYTKDFPEMPDLGSPGGLLSFEASAKSRFADRFIRLYAKSLALDSETSLTPLGVEYYLELCAEVHRKNFPLVEDDE